MYLYAATGDVCPDNGFNGLESCKLINIFGELELIKYQYIYTFFVWLNVTFCHCVADNSIPTFISTSFVILSRPFSLPSLLFRHHVPQSIRY